MVAGAAAFLVGDQGVAAELLGSSSSTTLLVDHFRAAGAAYDYYWEERWIRDEGYLKVGLEAVKAALVDAKVAPAEVTKFIFPAPGKGIADAIAKAAASPRRPSPIPSTPASASPARPTAS